MSSQTMTDDGFYKLTPEQSRRLAAAPSLKFEGFVPTANTQRFFAARGVDLDKLTISGQPSAEASGEQYDKLRRPRYEPLEARDQIRVLTILPGAGGDPLRCQLRHLSLQSPNSYDPELGSYEALSYTWNAPIRTRHYTTGRAIPGKEFTSEAWLMSALSGNAYTATDGTPPANFEPQDDQVDEQELMRPIEVLIDGAKCDVTSNLASALYHLRQPNFVRNLWVDAICIDQDNMQERGEQVSQMDRIYQSADTVHIWLGPAADGSDHAMVLAEHMWLYKYVHRRDPMELIDHKNLEDKATMLAAVEKLTVLLMRPWFTRRWVVQELALARDALVHCGSKTIGWQRLAYAVSFLQTRRLELTYMRIRDLYMRADPKLYRRGYMKTLAAETMVRISDDSIRRLPSPCTHPVFERRADLEMLLGSSHTLQCTNPLDTIYALLAVASDTTALGLDVPDYSKPFREVYMDVVLRIIERKQRLNILCHRWAAMTKSLSDLPSWIQSYWPAATRHEGGADVAQERQLFIGDGRYGSQFHAFGTKERKGVPAQTMNDESIGESLMVFGFIVDVIEHLGEGAHREIPGSWRDVALGATPQSCPEEAAKVQAALQAYHILPPRTRSVPQTQGARYAAFADLVTAASTQADNYTSRTYGSICEALFADSSPYRSHNERDAINIFEVRADSAPAALYSVTTGNQFDQDTVHDFLNRMSARTLNRAVARTSHGALALVDDSSRGAAVGDIVCVLRGCDVPVLLRPVNSMDFKANKATHGKFQFVCEAYVQGFMHGEAVRQAEGLAKQGDQYIGGMFLV